MLGWNTWGLPTPIGLQHTKDGGKSRVDTKLGDEFRSCTAHDQTKHARTDRASEQQQSKCYWYLSVACEGCFCFLCPRVVKVGSTDLFGCVDLEYQFGTGV